MAHYRSDNMTREEFLPMFQKHMQYTDEQMEIFQKEPKRTDSFIKFGSEEMQKWTLVVEVKKSHGCANGQKVGDRMFFRQGCGILDTEISDPFCAFCLSSKIIMVINTVQNLILAGVSPHNFYNKAITCYDSGVENEGWGLVVMEAFVIDDKDIDQYIREDKKRK